MADDRPLAGQSNGVEPWRQPFLQLLVLFSVGWLVRSKMRSRTRGRDFGAADRLDCHCLSVQLGRGFW